MLSRAAYNNLRKGAIVKKKEPQYPPLVLLNSVASRYPDVWEQMERIHESNGKDGLPSWPEWCYAPMSAAFAIAGNCTTDMFEVVKGMQAISAVAPWRLSKQVYRIDPDLGKLLIEQNCLPNPQTSQIARFAVF